MFGTKRLTTYYSAEAQAEFANPSKPVEWLIGIQKETEMR